MNKRITFAELNAKHLETTCTIDDGSETIHDTIKGIQHYDDVTMLTFETHRPIQRRQTAAISIHP